MILVTTCLLVVATTRAERGFSTGEDAKVPAVSHTASGLLEAHLHVQRMQVLPDDLAYKQTNDVLETLGSQSKDFHELVSGPQPGESKLGKTALDAVDGGKMYGQGLSKLNSVLHGVEHSLSQMAEGLRTGVRTEHTKEVEEVRDILSKLTSTEEDQSDTLAGRAVDDQGSADNALKSGTRPQGGVAKTVNTVNTMSTQKEDPLVIEPAAKSETQKDQTVPIKPVQPVGDSEDLRDGTINEADIEKLAKKDGFKEATVKKAQERTLKLEDCFDPAVTEKPSPAECEALGKEVGKSVKELAKEERASTPTTTTSTPATAP